MADKHTPGPWRTVMADPTSLGPHSVYGPKHPDGADYAPLCEVSNPHDASLMGAALALLEALEEFEISECPDCDGTGTEDEGGNDACHRCGGAGEVISGGWPAHVTAAIKAAKGAALGKEGEQ